MDSALRWKLLRRIELALRYVDMGYDLIGMEGYSPESWALTVAWWRR